MPWQYAGTSSVDRAYENVCHEFNQSTLCLNSDERVDLDRRLIEMLNAALDDEEQFQSVKRVKRYMREMEELEKKGLL